MRIQADKDELLKLFPQLYGKANTTSSLINALRVVRINDVDLAIMDVTVNHGFGWGDTYDLIFKCFTSVKSKEELAAEESVKKAEEALKAAKDMLVKIKE